jgi:hypothetical protein
MVIRVYLDGQELQDLPRGFDEFEEEIVRDRDVYGLVFKYPFDLTFVGDGYEYIRSQRKQNGFCKRIDIRIQAVGDFTRDIFGYIITADVVFNHTTKECSAPIEDNNFGSVLKQTKSVPVSVLSDTTRNGAAITPLTPIGITMFDPRSTADLTGARDMFDIVDVWTYVMAFLSDNALLFRSDFLSGLDDNKHIALTSGINMRESGSDVQLQVSFKDLMDFCYKKYNLWFRIEANNDGDLVFRLEPESDIFTASGVVVLDRVKNLEEAYLQEELAAVYSVGSKEEIKDLSGDVNLPYIAALTHAEEKYYSKGTCAIDVEKDLINEIRCGHNIIFDSVINDEAKYDDKVFAIQYIHTTSKATQGKYAFIIATTESAYNEELINLNVLTRFNTPTDLAINLNSADECVVGAITTSTFNITNASPNSIPVPLDSASTDTCGKFNTTTYRYTATGNEGFGASSSAILTVNSKGALAFIEVELTIAAYTSANVLKKAVSDKVVFSGITSAAIDLFGVFALNSGDYVQVEIRSVNLGVGNWSISVDQVNFSTFFQSLGGGAIPSSNPNEVKINTFEFERGLTTRDWRDICLNPAQGITVNTSGSNNSTGWIEKVSRNIKTGATKWMLITDNNNNSL